MPNFQEERDILSPKRASVHIVTENYPEGYDLELPRLNMRRTLRLSQLIEGLNENPKVKDNLDRLFTMFSAQDEGMGIQMILQFNSILASVDINQVFELFSIVTGKDAAWLDENLEPGWAIQVLRVAFEQQGFRQLFQGNTDPVADGENTLGKLQNEDSQPLSISYNQNTVGQTI